MGNFSRNTFDPAKRYVAVRLQQGVPLVDADWNELEDVTRFELYDGLSVVQPDVAVRGGLDVAPVGAGDDIVVSPGRAVVGGRPARLFAALRYSTQRYANAATAAADGVAAVAPIPLQQPAGLRTDTVYLDMFEREVASAEDPSLVNPAIGIETAVRLRREIVLRVAQGASTPPLAPSGHHHLPLALLNRRNAPIAADQVVDTKAYPLPLGLRELAVPPVVQPYVSYTAVRDPWQVVGSHSAVPTIFARKPEESSVIGIVPVVLPDGARLVQFRLRGWHESGSSTLFAKVVRLRQDFGTPSLVVSDVISAPGPFTRTLAPAPAEAVVDNAQSAYYVHLLATGAGATDVYAIAFRYMP